jgi:soluble P-type ATPase
LKTVIIPGWGKIHLAHVVLDLNGTITESGEFIPGVRNNLKRLVEDGYQVYILSGDTRGTLERKVADLDGCAAHITRTAEEKRKFVESIGPETTVAIGNGNIDLGMFDIAALSICTIQGEGATAKAVFQADIVVTHVGHAFEILLDSKKLIATLRA